MAKNQVVYGHVCKDCGQPFTIDKGEAEWYESKGFPLPKRCKECLKKRKEGKKGAIV